jgi:beta-hydroxylase
MFKYVYAIRRVGKRIKAWRRPTYYLVKWALFGSIIAGMFYLI